jgi:hypothetical protein
MMSRAHLSSVKVNNVRFGGNVPSMTSPGNLANVFVDLSVIPLHPIKDQARSLHIPLRPGNSNAEANNVIP